MNHHTLSDFRADHEAAFDGLLTDSVAALLAVGAVKLKRVAQDGMRVRASCGGVFVSFRRRGTLERHLDEAREQVDALKRQVDDGFWSMYLDGWQPQCSCGTSCLKALNSHLS